MKLIRLLIAFFIVLYLQIFFNAKTVFAATFDLIAPAGQLTVGQPAVFTVNINTGGTPLSTTEVGLSYDTSILQFVSAAPGNTFTTITPSEPSTGKLVLTGTSSTPFSGSGTFATITFNLVATAQSGATLCTLFKPSPPPTVPPQQPTIYNWPSGTPVPGQPTVPPPVPTALPETGARIPLESYGTVAIFLILSAFGGLAIRKK